MRITKILLLPTWGLFVIIDALRCVHQRVVRGETRVPIWKQPPPTGPAGERSLQGFADAFAIGIVYGAIGVLWLIGAALFGARPSTIFTAILMVSLFAAGAAFPEPRQ